MHSHANTLTLPVSSVGKLKQTTMTGDIEKTCCLCKSSIHLVFCSQVVGHSGVSHAHAADWLTVNPPKTLTGSSAFFFQLETAVPCCDAKRIIQLSSPIQRSGPRQQLPYQMHGSESCTGYHVFDCLTLLL